MQSLDRKGVKGLFLEPGDLQNHSNEEKGKEENRGKAMVALLAFIMATLDYFVAQKKKKKKKRKENTLEAKGLFGGNVFKNLARYTFLYITYIRHTVTFQRLFFNTTTRIWTTLANNLHLSCNPHISQFKSITYKYYEDALEHNYDTEDPAGSRILENHLSVM